MRRYKWKIEESILRRIRDWSSLLRTDPREWSQEKLH
jgi:hypothetical protein